METFTDPAEALKYCVSLCAGTTNRQLIRQAVTAAVAAAVDMDRGISSLLSFRDLELRWKLQRKTIERFDLPRIKLGGTVRFDRDDVLDFEKSNRTALTNLPAA